MRLSTFLSSMAIGTAISLSFSVGGAAAAGKVNLYCSAQEDWCQVMAKGFEKASGITVNMTRRSSGETFAKIKAESKNPKGDVWWGGTGDPHLQAAEEGLSTPYSSPNQAQLQAWAVAQSDSAGGNTIGIYSGALGFGYNEDLLKEKNLPVPACWKDLLKPEYKGHVQMANPNSSGTAYTTLATMVQLFGEDEGFSFMKGLHKNINQYTKSGSAPSNPPPAARTPSGLCLSMTPSNRLSAAFPSSPWRPAKGPAMKSAP